MIDIQKIGNTVDAVHAEVERAMALHRQLRSSHEAYAVLKEEVDEFWEEVKKKREARNKEAMRNELIQIAAMAVRSIVDLGL